MAGVSVPEPPAKPLSSSVLGIAIIAITGMQLMATLDGTIVIVALPRMQSELALSDASKSWVITAYVLMRSVTNGRSSPGSVCSPSPRWPADWPLTARC